MKNCEIHFPCCHNVMLSCLNSKMHRLQLVEMINNMTFLLYKGETKLIKPVEYLVRFHVSSALPISRRTVVQLKMNLPENRVYLWNDITFMCHQMAEFWAEKCCLPPLLSECLMLGFYEVGRGAFSRCLSHTPSLCAHPLFMVQRHA